MKFLIVLFWCVYSFIGALVLTIWGIDKLTGFNFITYHPTSTFEQIGILSLSILVIALHFVVFGASVIIDSHRVVK